MKEFIFNVCSVCLNPNRISRKSDKYDEFEISTAEHEGKWGVGVSYFYQLGGMSLVYLANYAPLKARPLPSFTEYRYYVSTFATDRLKAARFTSF